MSGACSASGRQLAGVNCFVCRIAFADDQSFDRIAPNAADVILANSFRCERPANKTVSTKPNRYVVTDESSTGGSL